MNDDIFRELHDKRKAIQIHLELKDLDKLDEYIKKQNITTRKKFIEFIILRFIKNIK